NRWSSVDLPEPDGPITDRKRPAGTSRETPASALLTVPSVLYSLTSSEASSTGRPSAASMVPILLPARGHPQSNTGCSTPVVECSFHVSPSGGRRFPSPRAAGGRLPVRRDG